MLNWEQSSQRCHNVQHRISHRNSARDRSAVELALPTVAMMEQNMENAVKSHLSQVGECLLNIVDKPFKKWAKGRPLQALVL